ncbi:MAG: peptidoglycan-binding domain-containing protein [Cocleimonas sp.]
MLNRSFASVAVLALLLPATQVMGESHGKIMPDRIDATNTLPDAKPGECYAKVIIPAQYDVKTETVLVKPVSEKVTVAPAVFDTAEKSIIEKEAFTKISVIPAKFREEIEQVEVSKAGTSWVTDLGKKGIPASPALLAGAKTNGVDLNGAAVGACYKEYYIAAKFEETTKEVLVKEESEEIKVAPAQFEETEETVVVVQASKKKVYVPAQYETIEERIEVEPAKAVWKKGDGPITKIDNSTGEIMCLIQVPAVYKTITKTVLKSASSIDLVEVPEETKAVKVTKLVSDATIDKVKIPAEYKTVTLSNKVSDASFTWTAGSGSDGGTYTGNQICLKDIPAKYAEVKKLVVDSAAAIEEDKIDSVAKLIKVSNVVTPAKESRQLVQAEYKTVEKTTRIASERLEWRRILCRTNMGPDINKRIQQALKDAGVYNGPVDGAVGKGTMSAVERYQEQNGLATGGITIDMLEKLGVM